MTQPIEDSPPMAKKPTILCVMPTRGVPDALAWRALCAAVDRYGPAAKIMVSAIEPREKNRNVQVQAFLDHPAHYDFMLCVDDDTPIPIDALEKLVAVDEPVVSGCQPLWMGGELVWNIYPFAAADGYPGHWPDVLREPLPAEAIPILYCGFGCVLIERTLLERMGFPWFREDYGNARGEFQQTEDIYFCAKALRAGGRIWAAPNVVCGHRKTVDLLEWVPRSKVQVPADAVPDDGTPRPHAYKEIPGWFPTSAERLFASVVETADPGETLIEIGTYLGRSACYLAECAALRGVQLDLRTVDHFRGSAEHTPEQRRNLKERCHNYLRASGVGHLLTICETTSTNCALSHADESVAFVYLDGSHDYESVRDDISAWWPKIRPGGVLAGDDFAPEFRDVQNAVLEFTREGGLILAWDGRTWAVKKGFGNPFEIGVMLMEHYTEEEFAAPGEGAPAALQHNDGLDGPPAVATNHAG
jgi:predicted O-methyltransferase YrrM